MSHLWASVAQESASRTPAVRCLSTGAAAAHSPKAPSTWTHAPARLAQGTIASAGSQAPVLTLPAWMQTIAGPESGGSASARIRPCASTGTVTTRERPSPSRPSDLTSVGCASSPTTTVIGGAPNSPCASTSHPARASSAWRAAASAVKLATVAPVTNPPPHSGGSPSTSSSQRRLMRSSSAVAGVTACSPVFWSQAPARQFAATVTGSAAPITNPKKRGPAIAMVAGEPISSSRRRTTAGSVGPSGSGASHSARRASAAGSGATRRSPSPSR